MNGNLIACAILALFIVWALCGTLHALWSQWRR